MLQFTGAVQSAEFNPYSPKMDCHAFKVQSKNWEWMSVISVEAESSAATRFLPFLQEAHLPLSSWTHSKQGQK